MRSAETGRTAVVVVPEQAALERERARLQAARSGKGDLAKTIEEPAAASVHTEAPAAAADARVAEEKKIDAARQSGAALAEKRPAAPAPGPADASPAEPRATDKIANTTRPSVDDAGAPPAVGALAAPPAAAVAPAPSAAPPAAPAATASPSARRDAGAEMQRSKEEAAAGAAKPSAQRLVDENRARALAPAQGASTAQPGESVPPVKARPVRRTPAMNEADVENDPPRWIQRIIALRDAGYDADADRELARLRERYPSLEIPPNALRRAGTR
jgi:hypothetical protein